MLLGLLGAGLLAFASTKANALMDAADGPGCSLEDPDAGPGGPDETGGSL